MLVLPDGEKKLSETCTIARYLANKHNLAPKDCFDDAQASMILEVLNGAYFKLPFFEKDEEEKVGNFHCKLCGKFLSKIVVIVYPSRYDDKINACLVNFMQKVNQKS